MGRYCWWCSAYQLAGCDRRIARIWHLSASLRRSDRRHDSAASPARYCESQASDEASDAEERQHDEDTGAASWPERAKQHDRCEEPGHCRHEAPQQHHGERRNRGRVGGPWQGRQGTGHEKMLSASRDAAPFVRVRAVTHASAVICAPGHPIRGLFRRRPASPGRCALLLRRLRARSDDEVW